MALRSVVIGETTLDSVENATMPTAKRDGSRLRKRRIAWRAAPSRDGFTSVAIIERETSTSRITVPSSRVPRTVARGRAVATHRDASASAASTSGTIRRHREVRSTTDARMSRFVKATA